jgi:predicted transcriptional regulator of viral defense system
MKYLEFRSKLEKLPVFNLNDIRKIAPGFYKPQLTYWQEKGLIRSIAGGYYTFGDVIVNNSLLNILANKIIQPSYISLESALSYYQVIPERVYGVTSVTSKKTARFESRWGIFNYRKIKPSLLFGYDIIPDNQNGHFLIAKLEKAILDYLYLNFQIDSIDDFIGLRWDKEELYALVRNETFKAFVKKFNKNALNHRVNILMRYLDDKS